MNNKNIDTSPQNHETLPFNNNDEIMFRMLVNNSHDGISLLGPDGKLGYVTPSVERIMGYTYDEILGLDPATICYPDDLPRMAALLENLATRPGETQNIMYRMRHKDGSWRWLDSNVTNCLNEPGINAFVYNYKDVTEKVIAEEKLQLDRNNRDALVNSITESMWSFDTDIRLIDANQAFKDFIKLFTGLDLKQGDSLLFEGYFDSHTIEQWTGWYNMALSGKIFIEENSIPYPTQNWYQVSFTPIITDGAITGAVCFSKDITERKAMEEERKKITADLLQRNKDLEQFTYIVSHNLRSPVSNIIGLTDVLKDEESGELRDMLTVELNNSVTKLDTVIKDLSFILQTKREITHAKEVVSFTDLVNDIKASIYDILKSKNVIIESEFSAIDSMPAIKSYLYSIFYNLITNSIKYRQPDINPHITIKSQLTGNGIELTFSDNGMGIDLDKQGGNVFGMYKRFHQHIEGKGMGLFMVKNQVETIGGSISIASKVNEGTQFKIVFKNNS